MLIPETAFIGTNSITYNAAPEMRLLVVDDDATIRQACATIATEIGFIVESAGTIGEARNAIHRSDMDVVLLDVHVGTENGLSLLEQLHADTSRTRVIVMTAFPTVDLALNAFRLGAFEFVQKPFSLEELTSALESAMHQRLDTNSAQHNEGYVWRDEDLLLSADRSPAMARIRRILCRIAPRSHPVLIVGEPGSGKALLARSVHLNSPHATGPFITLDCRSLSISELDGAVFPANRNTDGILHSSAASDVVGHGTVFLREIGSLSEALQSRLLRILQEYPITTASGDSSPALNRILAASSCRLDDLVASGRFRRDLFQRLNVFSLCVPPLRERRSQIPRLAAYMLDRAAQASAGRHRFDKNAIRLLIEYDWPKNLREFQETIDYACTVSEGVELCVADLPEHIQNYCRDGEIDGISGNTRFSDAGPKRWERPPGVLPMAEVEKETILNALKQLNGDKLLAAKALGIGKTTLYRKLKEYQIGVLDYV